MTVATFPLRLDELTQVDDTSVGLDILSDNVTVIDEGVAPTGSESVQSTPSAYVSRDPISTVVGSVSMIGTSSPYLLVIAKTIPNHPPVAWIQAQIVSTDEADCDTHFSSQNTR